MCLRLAVSSELQEILVLAKSLAQKVGEQVRSSVENKADFAVQHKGVRDLVTEIDLWAEEEIFRGVSERFSEHVVVGEESAGRLVRESGSTLEEISSSGTCWFIDPIDGTTNFVNLLPHACISIGVVRDREKIAGVVYDPFANELFSALRGQGAMLNDKPIEIGSKERLIEALIGTSFPDRDQSCFELYTAGHSRLIASCRKLRVLGSAALDLCWVACGRLDSYINVNLKPWDVAAASLIVEEAGGKLSNIEAGHEGGYSIFDSSILAANEALSIVLHKELKNAT